MFSRTCLHLGDTFSVITPSLDHRCCCWVDMQLRLRGSVGQHTAAMMARLRICHHCAKFTICGTLCDGTTPPSSCETSTPQSEVLPAARSNGADYPVAYEGMQDMYDKHLLTVERLFPSFRQKCGPNEFPALISLHFDKAKLGEQATYVACACTVGVRRVL